MRRKFEAVFCIVNTGFSDSVMDAAKRVGASGGTVITARGTANSEAEQLFKITVQPEKEIVMMLVPATIKDDVLHALYKADAFCCVQLRKHFYGLIMTAVQIGHNFLQRVEYVHASQFIVPAVSGGQAHSVKHEAI